MGHSLRIPALDTPEHPTFTTRRQPLTCRLGRSIALALAGSNDRPCSWVYEIWVEEVRGIGVVEDNRGTDEKGAYTAGEAEIRSSVGTSAGFSSRTSCFGFSFRPFPQSHNNCGLSNRKQKDERGR